MPEILIYDEIGPDWAGMVSAISIKNQLAKLQGMEVTARINSPGGSVFEAMSIYNSFASHPGGVVAVIDGVAASAASYITLAAKRIEISENGIYMLHPVVGAIRGSIDEIKKYIELMELANTQTMSAYTSRSPEKAKEIESMFTAETWLSPQQVVEYGLADSIGQKYIGPTPKVPKNMYRNTPQNLLAESVEDIEINKTRIREYLQNKSSRLDLEQFQGRINELKQI